MDRLPVELYPKILSYLDVKGAGRLATLSHAWETAFYTGGSVSLHHADFGVRDAGDNSRFLDYGLKWLRKHEEQGCAVHSFTLSVSSLYNFGNRYILLINRAVKLGAKEISFAIQGVEPKFKLDISSILGKLSVSGCEIELDYALNLLNNHEKQGCAVQSFSLSVNEEEFIQEFGDTFIILLKKAVKLGAREISFAVQIMKVVPNLRFDISSILGKNLVEKLSVAGSEIVLGDEEYRSSILNDICLKEVNMTTDSISQILSMSSLIKYLHIQFHYTLHSVPIILDTFLNLSTLILNGVFVQNSDVFKDMVTTFPVLKELTLDRCKGFYDGIIVSSSSLETVVLKNFPDMRDEDQKIYVYWA